MGSLHRLRFHASRSPSWSKCASPYDCPTAAFLPASLSGRVLCCLHGGVLCSIGHLFPRQRRPLMHLPTTWQGSLCRRRPLSFSVRSVRISGCHGAASSPRVLCVSISEAPNPTQTARQGLRAFARAPADCLLEGVVPPTGLEPVTPALRMRCSTN
jgi:hypothetical protein